MAAPKKGSNRVKGNLKPSSSSQAALLLGQTPGFIGFGGQSSPSYVPLSSMLEDVDSSLDADIGLVLRKLSKKDTTTKIKALQELSNLCQQKDTEVLKSMLPFWPRLYNRLSMDLDCKVREAVHNTFLVVSVRVGKEIAPYLKSIMGSWIVSQCDTYPTVAFSAIKVFQNTFPGNKQNNALSMYRQDILDFLVDNLVNQTPQSLSDPKTTSQVEMDSKYSRIIASSLLGCRKLFTSVVEDKLSTLEASLTDLFENGKFWKHSKSAVPGIKGGFYSFLAVVCQSFQELATKFSNKITPIVLHNLDITNPLIVAPMWEAILSLVNHVPDCWNHVSWQKGFWPKLRKNLENGFVGNAASVSLNLMPLLSKIPELAVEDKDSFYIEFLTSFRKGFNEDSVLNSTSDCAALIKSFVECCQYLIVQAVNREDQEFAEKILDQFLVEIVKTAILDEKPTLASSPVFSCVASLMESFEKSVKMLNLAEFFWKHFEDFACQLVEDEHKSKKILRLLKLIKGFVTKNAQSKKTVKFDADMQDPPKLPKSDDSVEIQSQNMMNFYTKVLCEIFQKIDVREEVDIFFDLFTEVFLLFSNERIITSFLGKGPTSDNIYLCFFDDFILPHLKQHRKNLDRSSCLMSMSFKCINDNLKNTEVASSLLDKLIENCCSMVQSSLLFENMIEMQKKRTLQLKLNEEAVSMQLIELVKETSLMSSNSIEPALVKLVDKGWTIISSVLAVCEEGSVFNTQCAENILFTIGQELIVHMKNANKKTTLNQAIQFVTKAACSFFDNLKGILCQTATEELMISLFAISFDTSLKLEESVLDSCEEAWTKGLKVLLKFNSSDIYTGPFVETSCEVLKQATLSKDTTSELFERVLKNLEVLFELLFADLKEDELAEDIFELLLQRLFIDKRYTPELKYLLSLIYVHQNVVSITNGFTNHSSNSLPNLLVVIHQTMFNLKLMKQMFTVNSSSALKKQGSDALKSFEKRCLLSVFRGLALAKKIMNFEPSKDEKMLSKHLDELKSNVDFIIGQLSERDVKNILEEAKKSAVKHGEFDAVYLNCMYEQIVPKFFDFDEAELLKDGGLPSSGMFHTLQVLLPLFSVEGVRVLLLTQVTNFLRSLITTDPWLPSKSLSLSLSCLRILQEHPEEKHYREKLCRDILQQILTWRESDEKLFITADDDTGDFVQIVNNIEIMKFLSFVVGNCVDLLSDKDWDFILCALVAWIEKVISYESYDSLEVHAVVFAVTVTNLLTKISHCMLETSKSNPMYFPPNLLSEWDEFFSEGLYGELLPRYVTLAADQSESDDVFKKTVVDSMGEALSRCSKDQILKHKLPTYLSAEDDVTLSQSTQTFLNHVCPLLISSRSNIQTTAFNMIEKLMNEESLFQEKPEEDSPFAEEACVKSPPKAIIDVITKCSDALEILLVDHSIGDYVTVDDNTEAHQFTFGYLLSWKLVLCLFKRANPQFRAMYASYLKESNLFSKFLIHLFILLHPERANSAGDLKISSEHFMENGTHDIHQIAFGLYYQCLETTPALVRQWWTDLDRKTSLQVDKFTSKFMSPMLCSDEISSIPPASDDLEGITIKPRPSTREVVATYVMAEVKIVVTITFPENFPLGMIAVNGDKRVGATQAQWDRWLFQLNIFLQHQNGTIMEGLKLWKKNIDKRFDGVEDCMICFSVLHGTTFQLPKLQCRTCKKKYHSACLYKWFSTSMNSTCPLCRNLF